MARKELFYWLLIEAIWCMYAHILEHTSEGKREQFLIHFGLGTINWPVAPIAAVKSCRSLSNNYFPLSHLGIICPLRPLTSQGSMRREWRYHLSLIQIQVVTCVFYTVLLDENKF